MSYDVELIKDGEPVRVQRHTEGGTYVAGGTDLAEFSVTFNYADLFRKVLGEDIRNLSGRTARDTIQPLALAVADLGVDRDTDYWKATPGNAGWALAIMLSWAIQHPDATWRIA